MSLKESDITRAMSSMIGHVKNKVRNNIVASHRRSLVKGLDDKQVAQLCNIVDSTIDEAFTAAVASEAKGLYNLFNKK